MLKIIRPQKIFRTINAPASKSIMQRAVVLATLSEGETILHQPSYCDDSIAALEAANSIGAKIQKFEKKIIIERTKKIINYQINCGESGLLVRMFSPVLSLFDKNFTINGKGSLLNRPINIIEKALIKFGVSCNTNNGLLPVKISGKLRGGKIKIDASLSSQLLTGLLIALPLADNDSEILVSNLTSKPYIDLTLKMVNDFGVYIENIDYKIFRIKGKQKYKSQNYIIEKDWSASAFLLVAGLIAGRIEIKNLNLSSLQADKKIINAIKSANGKISFNNNSVITEASKLSAFEFDARNSPDLFPPLVCMAAYCKGTSKIKGISRLRHKESNRSEVLKNEFLKLGIKIKNENDFMYITGGKISGANLFSHNDHRIAMALTVAGLSAEDNIIIKNAECVNKSYPNFYKDIRI